MKNILILVKKFSFDLKNPWLWDDMAQAILNKGGRIMIGLLDYSGRSEIGVFKVSKDITIVSYPITSKNQLGKIIQAFWGNIWLFYKIKSNSNSRFDCLFTGSIVSMFILTLLLLRISSKPKIWFLFLWDFFPIHHAEVGRITLNTFILKIAYILESTTINMFDIVGLMSKKSLDFFKKYHPKYKGKYVEIPVWGTDRSDDINHDESIVQINSSEFHVVFGGQLVKGRGINVIIKLSERLRKNNVPVYIHVYGDGILRNLLKKEENISYGARLIYHGLVDRTDYLNGIKKFDAGLIITVPGVSVPTFPSKVIDYFVAGKPVLAFVEPTTDFGQIIQDDAGAGIMADVSSFEEMYSQLIKMSELKFENNGYELINMGKNGRQFFKKNMEVSVVLNKVYNNIGSHCCPNKSKYQI